MLIWLAGLVLGSPEKEKGDRERDEDLKSDEDVWLETFYYQKGNCVEFCESACLLSYQITEITNIFF